MQKFDVKNLNSYTAPEKVLQIGEGNFLRAFADYILEKANQSGLYSGKAVVVQPIPEGNCQKINENGCKYTLLMRGIKNGKVYQQAEKINSISRCINPYTNYNLFLECAKNPELEIIISNTTEAGIAISKNEKLNDSPPATFPAKMAVILHERFKFFKADKTKGFLFLPVELIDDNGKKLKESICFYARLWNLGDDFLTWVDESCTFANTLVDRIVTGFPQGEEKEIFESLAYEDPLLVTAEPFLFWAIECDKSWAKRFPIDKLGLDIVFEDDINAYRTRKVRILNGAHTLSVLEAFLAGHDTVLEMMQDKHFNEHIKRTIYDEIIPSFLQKTDGLEDFANAVLERFSNPFIKHRLLDISLNSISKYKARCLPSLLDYVKKHGDIPKGLVRAIAALIAFYKGEWIDNKFYGKRKGQIYEIRDNIENLEIISKAWSEKDPIFSILSSKPLWGMDLNEIPKLYNTVLHYFNLIDKSLQ